MIQAIVTKKDMYLNQRRIADEAGVARSITNQEKPAQILTGAEWKQDHESNNKSLEEWEYIALDSLDWENMIASDVEGQEYNIRVQQ